jgi:hypothetical protein
MWDAEHLDSGPNSEPVLSWLMLELSLGMLLLVFVFDQSHKSRLSD